MKSDAFRGCYIEYATLHVPNELIPLYSAVEPWKSFGKIVAIEGDNPTQEQCEKPNINYENGQLKLSCSTDGAEFVTKITNSDINEYYTATISLAATYNISVYATKAGYKDSETATATLCWIEQEPKTEGITDGIAQMAARAIIVKAEGGQLTVEGADDNTYIVVYSIDGNQVGTTNSRNGMASINTAITKDSVVLVKIGNKSLKIIMK